MFQIIQVLGDKVKIHYVGYHKRHDTMVQKRDIHRDTAEAQSSTKNYEPQSDVEDDEDGEQVEQYIAHVSDAILDMIAGVEKAGYQLPGKGEQPKCTTSLHDSLLSTKNNRGLRHI